jgi:hypothetical protein
MSLNGTLDSLVGELERMLVQAEAEVYTRQQALDEAKEEARRLRAILKAAGVAEEPAPKPKQREARVNEETRSRVLAAIYAHELNGLSAIEGVPGSFVVTDITGDFHETSARTTIGVLREEGLIRVVGKKPVGRARSPLAYARVSDE